MRRLPTAMWNQLKRWLGRAGNQVGAGQNQADAEQNQTGAGRRLFSVFDFDETSSDALCEQIDTDLLTWGYDSYESLKVAKCIAEKAAQSASLDTHQTAQHRDLIDAIHADDVRTLERLVTERGDGVTVDDMRWYWSIHSVARAAMTHFDEELRGRMWLSRHIFNICVEDLEQDVKRQLPVFGDRIADDADSPLPIELKRRFILFITRTKRSLSSYEKWNLRLRKASSMNSLIRELIASGDL